MRENIVERVKEMFDIDRLLVRSILSPREIKVIRLRCGLENGRIYTSKEIGIEFKITPIEVRGITYRALDKLLSFSI